MSQHFDPAIHVILRKEEAEALHRAMDFIATELSNPEKLINYDPSVRGSTFLLLSLKEIRAKAEDSDKIMQKAFDRVSPPLPNEPLQFDLAREENC